MKRQKISVGKKVAEIFPKTTKIVTVITVAYLFLVVIFGLILVDMGIIIIFGIPVVAYVAFYAGLVYTTHTFMERVEARMGKKK